MSLLIVGNSGGTNVGGNFLSAALSQNLEAHLLESRLAFEAPKWVRRFNWWLRGRRPTWLGRFSQQVLCLASQSNATVLLTTGIAPLQKPALSSIRSLGIKLINYLTDDPWNPAHFAPWFMQTLPLYDYVFTPRRANMPDLAKLGCSNVTYLPFAYAPELHFPQPNQQSSDVDIMFAGGADQDRIPYIVALIQQGFKVALYGDYWDRFPETRASYRGYADPQMLRQATQNSKICLGLVRRSNRDGHVMRSFEIPAIGGCFLAEDTSEHKAIFGAEGQATLYFDSIPQLIKKSQWLLDHPETRIRLAAASHALITNGSNTYNDRLATILQRACQSQDLHQVLRSTSGN